VAGHVGVAHAESASRGGARGGGGLCTTRGGGVVVLRGGAAVLGMEIAAGSSPEKKNRGGGSAARRGGGRTRQQRRGVGPGGTGRSVEAQTSGAGGRWVGIRGGGGGAELRRVGRWKKGGRDLSGICENFRGSTVNKIFLLF